MYELAMVEWGLTPEYINENWSEEELWFLFEARNKRLRKLRGSGSAERSAPYTRELSNEDFFKQHGIKPKEMTCLHKT